MPSKPGTHSPMPRLTARHQPVVDDNTWRAGKTTAQRGYGGWWQRARLSFLRRNPLCAQCDSRGAIRLANVVDHIVPHRGNAKLFRDVINWQPLCTPCHNAKAARERQDAGA